MTRKDFELIAEALGLAIAITPAEEEAGARRAARVLANALDDNCPTFDRARFVQAVQAAAAAGLYEAANVAMDGGHYDRYNDYHRRAGLAI